MDRAYFICLYLLKEHYIFKILNDLVKLSTPKQ